MCFLQVESEQEGGEGVFEMFCQYQKTPKYSDTQKITVIILKFEQCGSL